jgi:PIN domain nuclease of toxin-antitoxin system
MLDASVVLADLLGEGTSDIYLEALEAGALLPAINLAEVATTLRRAGASTADVVDIASAQNIVVVPLTEDIALMAAELEAIAAPLGLSLADRVCLATSEVFGSTHLLTTDRAWLELPEPYASRVVFARPD